MPVRAGDDLAHAALRLARQLWPLTLVWPVWRTGSELWRAVLLSFPDNTTRGYTLAYGAWPTVALVGPVLLMMLAVTTHRLRRTGRFMPLAAIVAVGATISLTVRPEWQRLAPYIGRVGPLDLARTLNPAVAAAAGLGLAAIGIAVRILCGERATRPDLQRAQLRQSRPCRLARHARRTNALPWPRPGARRPGGRRGLPC